MGFTLSIDSQEAVTQLVVSTRALYRNCDTIHYAGPQPSCYLNVYAYALLHNLYTNPMPGCRILIYLYYPRGSCEVIGVSDRQLVDSSEDYFFTISRLRHHQGGIAARSVGCGVY